MFTPDNDKLKTIIFHLLKKKPMINASIPTWKYGDKEVTINYPCHPYILENNEESNKWITNINIFNGDIVNDDGYYVTGADVNLTEKEAMELKWALDDIMDSAKQNLFDELASFALEEKGLQDDLLDN